MKPGLMRAMVCTAAGGPEVLQLRELPIPELPSPKHIRVRLRAAGVNPVDTKMRKRGTLRPQNLPAILGCDGAGVVDARGAEARRFSEGDEVYFFNGGVGLDPGTYAEYTTVHEDYVAPKPKRLSIEEAAAVPLVWITNWESLFERFQLAPGANILIHAGAGGTGHLAIQMAHQAGYQVMTTVRGEERAAWLRKLGAQRTVDYTQEDFATAALHWTGGRGVDLVYDTVGGATFTKSFAALRPYGYVVTLLEPPATTEEIVVAKQRTLSIAYEMMLTPTIFSLHDERVRQGKVLEKANAAFDEQGYEIRLQQVLPLEQAAEAHRILERGGLTGKLVLQI